MRHEQYRRGFLRQNVVSIFFSAFPRVKKLNYTGAICFCPPTCCQTTQCVRALGRCSCDEEETGYDDADDTVVYARAPHHHGRLYSRGLPQLFSIIVRLPTEARTSKSEKPCSSSCASLDLAHMSHSAYSLLQYGLLLCMSPLSPRRRSVGT
jgi:hypothetical protein